MAMTHSPTFILTTSGEGLQLPQQDLAGPQGLAVKRYSYLEDMIMTLTQKTRHVFLLAVATFFLFATLSHAADFKDDVALLERTSKAISHVAETATPAVVHVDVEKSVKAQQMPSFEFFENPFFEHFFGPDFRQQVPKRQERKQRGQGSGFIINKEGYILTNYHVVSDADEITVTLNDNTKVEAELVGTDPQSDIALIKIDHGNNLPFLPLGDSDKMKVGEWVIAIGNPFGLDQTVTVGVISAKGRSKVGLNEYENFIQTDAAINPGNSGGPMLNIYGEVVGINSALYSRTGGYMGIGFAIPVNMVKAIKDQLMNNGKVIRGWLGVVIQDVNEDLAQSFGLEKARGILISEVQKDSPADKAGIEQGDIIVSLNGVELKNSSDLRNRVAMVVPGTKTDVGIIRNGKEQSIKVKIGEQPKNFARGGKSYDPGGAFYEKYGLSFQELTPELAEQLGYRDEEGVLIGDVEPDSAADSAGLQPGQLIQEINKKRVTSLDDVDKVMKQSTDTGRILLRVHSGRYSQYVVLVAE
ncbi:unnamed protein product [Cyprideis torosa]|uniref:Probable periplasmic serine endoprotease DegP-like n=1 Tax=Cyprideis torosa TaxID=163714 RepID=A0A7R8ZS72_9CRUS|nr:unnamed protein product [Cyprideis torosa]CAG0906205.1 unnamed protein product [Cyprideis torosa]